MTENPQEPAEPARKTTAYPGAPREIDSRELMQGEREIAIRHGGDRYRLTITRAGKLILHK